MKIDELSTGHVKECSQALVGHTIKKRFGKKIEYFLTKCPKGSHHSDPYK